MLNIDDSFLLTESEDRLANRDHNTMNIEALLIKKRKEIGGEEKQITLAKKFMSDSNMTLIIPCKDLYELEQQHSDFQNMDIELRRRSDWRCLEIFGVRNLQFYHYLKKYLDNSTSIKYNKTITSANTPLNYTEAAEYLLEKSMSRKNILEEDLVSNAISDVLDKLDNANTIVDDISFGDMPYYEPDQMIDMGVNANIPEDNYYGVLADNTQLNEDTSVKEWFESYKKAAVGFYEEFSNLNSSWVNKVKELSYGLESLTEQEDILRRKQSLLELGWNPEIEFTNKARLMTKEFAKYDILSSTQTRIIDLREFQVDEIENDNLILETNENSELKPIYIVLIEGTSLFSKAIKTYTKSAYSHAAISFSASLGKMFSFNIGKKTTGNFGGGFSIETIRDIGEDQKLNVFMILLKKEDFDKMHTFVKKLEENMNNTRYNFKNIVNLVLGIGTASSSNMICSQFVDRCLKIANINVTKKVSNLVTPGDIATNMNKSKKRNIYNLFEDIRKEYKSSKIRLMIDSLLKRDKFITEAENKFTYRNEKDYTLALLSNIGNISRLSEMRSQMNIVCDPLVKKILESVVFDSITGKVYCEAKEFPIQFDNDGNLLIKDLKRIDFNAEYAKSHTLLKEYEETNNIEGIKYELSKLFMMNCLIEEKLHSPKNDKDVKALNDSRARILNDFKYYMDIVGRAEPSFNFTRYYEDSPFNRGTTKINRSTMTFVTKMIKEFIKPI